jgi:hypothetical protein
MASMYKSPYSINNIPSSHPAPSAAASPLGMVNSCPSSPLPYQLSPGGLIDTRPNEVQADVELEAMIRNQQYSSGGIMQQVELLEVIGEGSFGVVYKGESVTVDQLTFGVVYKGESVTGDQLTFGVVYKGESVTVDQLTYIVRGLKDENFLN